MTLIHSVRVSVYQSRCTSTRVTLQDSVYNRICLFFSAPVRNYVFDSVYSAVGDAGLASVCSCLDQKMDEQRYDT